MKRLVIALVILIVSFVLFGCASKTNAPPKISQEMMEILADEEKYSQFIENQYESELTEVIDQNISTSILMEETIKNSLPAECIFSEDPINVPMTLGLVGYFQFTRSTTAIYTPWDINSRVMFPVTKGEIYPVRDDAENGYLNNGLLRIENSDGVTGWAELKGHWCKPKPVQP